MSGGVAGWLPNFPPKNDLGRESVKMMGFRLNDFHRNWRVSSAKTVRTWLVNCQWPARRVPWKCDCPSIYLSTLIFFWVKSPIRTELQVRSSVRNSRDLAKSSKRPRKKKMLSIRHVYRILYRIYTTIKSMIICIYLDDHRCVYCTSMYKYTCDKSWYMYLALKSIVTMSNVAWIEHPSIYSVQRNR